MVVLTEALWWIFCSHLLPMESKDRCTDLRDICHSSVHTDSSSLTVTVIKHPWAATALSTVGSFFPWRKTDFPQRSIAACCLWWGAAVVLQPGPMWTYGPFKPPYRTCKTSVALLKSAEPCRRCRCCRYKQTDRCMTFQRELVVQPRN